MRRFTNPRDCYGSTFAGPAFSFTSAEQSLKVGDLEAGIQHRKISTLRRLSRNDKADIP